MRARVRSNRQPIRQRQSSGPVSIESCSTSPSSGPILPNQEVTINFTLANENNQSTPVILDFGGNGTSGQSYQWFVPANGTENSDTIVPSRDLDWPVNSGGQLQTEMIVRHPNGAVQEYTTCGTIQIQPRDDGGNGDNGNGGNGGNGNGGNGQPGQGGQELSMQTIGLVVLVLLAVVYTQTDWLNQAYDAASGAI